MCTPVAPLHAFAAAGPGDAAPSLAVVAAAGAADIRISLIRVNTATARERRLLPDAAENIRLFVRAVQSPGCKRSIDGSGGGCFIIQKLMICIVGRRAAEDCCFALVDD